MTVRAALREMERDLKELRAKGDEITEQIEAFETAIEALSGGKKKSPRLVKKKASKKKVAVKKAKGKKKGLSKAGREAIAAAQKKRWAKVKREKAAAVKKKVPKKKASKKKAPKNRKKKNGAAGPVRTKSKVNWRDVVAEAVA